METARAKILLIRFSSFGDIIQSLTAVDHLAEQFPQSVIHWVTRDDFAELVQSHPRLAKTWILVKRSGLGGLWALVQELRAQKYTHVYDAHSNLRSHLLCWWLRFPGWGGPQFLRRSKNRFLRFLLFRFHLQRLPWPYAGAQSFVWPLARWQVKWNPQRSRALSLPALRPEVLRTLRFQPAKTLVLAPSAAWEMKRWPLSHWQELIRRLPARQFFVLGGPQDKFCEELTQVDPSRVQNLAGLLSWIESARLVSESQGVVCGDTGVMHLSDYLGRPTFALMGPTAFGFPSWPNSHTLEVPLACRPCTKDGRGRCRLKEYQKCLVDIRPEVVATMIDKHLPM